jgi:hypothetical protein
MDAVHPQPLRAAYSSADQLTAGQEDRYVLRRKIAEAVDDENGQASVPNTLTERGERAAPTMQPGVRRPERKPRTPDATRDRLNFTV